MFNPQDPTHMAIAIFILSFICIMGIFYLFEPSCVTIIDQDNGMTILSKTLVFVYSFTFSLACSICAMLFVSKNRVVTEKSYDVVVPEIPALPRK